MLKLTAEHKQMCSSNDKIHLTVIRSSRSKIIIQNPSSTSSFSVMFRLKIELVSLFDALIVNSEFSYFGDKIST